VAITTKGISVAFSLQITLVGVHNLNFCNVINCHSLLSSQMIHPFNFDII
jgi:hypothetical protein